MLSIFGESGEGGFEVTYLKHLYLFARGKGVEAAGVWWGGVAGQAHPVCLHAVRPGSAFQRALCTPACETWLEK